MYCQPVCKFQDKTNAHTGQNDKRCKNPVFFNFVVHFSGYLECWYYINITFIISPSLIYPTAQSCSREDTVLIKSSEFCD